MWKGRGRRAPDLTSVYEAEPSPTITSGGPSLGARPARRFFVEVRPFDRPHARQRRPPPPPDGENPVTPASIKRDDGRKGLQSTGADLSGLPRLSGRDSGGNHAIANEAAGVLNR